MHFVHDADVHDADDHMTTTAKSITATATVEVKKMKSAAMMAATSDDDGDGWVSEVAAAVTMALHTTTTTCCCLLHRRPASLLMERGSVGVDIYRYHSYGRRRHGGGGGLRRRRRACPRVRKFSRQIYATYARFPTQPSPRTQRWYAIFPPNHTTRSTDRRLLPLSRQCLGSSVLRLNSPPHTPSRSTTATASQHAPSLSCPIHSSTTTT